MFVFFSRWPSWGIPIPIQIHMAVLYTHVANFLHTHTKMLHKLLASAWTIRSCWNSWCKAVCSKQVCIAFTVRNIYRATFANCVSNTRIITNTRPLVIFARMCSNAAVVANVFRSPVNDSIFAHALVKIQLPEPIFSTFWTLLHHVHHYDKILGRLLTY